jgi:hypothetical protein
MTFRPDEFCPLCAGRGTMQHDSGPVECPACASRARHTAEDDLTTPGALGQQSASRIASALTEKQRYGGAGEAERLRQIHDPEVIVGYISPRGDTGRNWFESLDPMDIAKADAEWQELRDAGLSEAELRDLSGAQ